jgi:hypothetical protein
MQRKNLITTDIHNQEKAEDFETNCCEYCEDYVQTAKKDKWIECVNSKTGFLSSVLHANTNAVESYCERKTAKYKGRSRKFRSLQLRLMSSFG